MATIIPYFRGFTHFSLPCLMRTVIYSQNVDQNFLPVLALFARAVRADFRVKVRVCNHGYIYRVEWIRRHVWRHVMRVCLRRKFTISWPRCCNTKSEKIFVVLVIPFCFLHPIYQFPEAHRISLFVVLREFHQLRCLFVSHLFNSTYGSLTDLQL